MQERERFQGVELGENVFPALDEQALEETLRENGDGSCEFVDELRIGLDRMSP